MNMLPVRKISYDQISYWTINNLHIRLLFILLASFYSRDIWSQDNDCKYSITTFYTMDEFGIDIDAQNRAKNYVVQMIAKHYPSVPTKTISKILNSKGLLGICKSQGRNITTAYAEKSRVKEALSCTPGIEFDLTCQSLENTVCQKIENNIGNLFTSIYCKYTLNKKIDYHGITISENAIAKTTFLMDNYPFRSFNNVNRLNLTKLYSQLFCTYIPVIVQMKGTDTEVRMVQFFINSNGRIEDLAFKMDFDEGVSLPDNVETCLNTFFTNYYTDQKKVLDTLSLFLTSPTQRNYYAILQNVFKSNGPVYWNFKVKEAFPVESQSCIYKIGIEHGYKTPENEWQYGYLIIYIENRPQAIFNNFRWSKTK